MERVGDDGRHVLRDTEVVGEEETYGTADIDHLHGEGGRWERENNLLLQRNTYMDPEQM